MLRIYPVSLDMVRRVRPYADQIARHDKDHARQLRRSSSSIVLNLAEGAGTRDGRRRTRYGDALGSAFETLANLEAAEAIGYVGELDAELRDRLGHVIATLVKLTR
jgi:four helix bundle protein